MFKEFLLLAIFYSVEFVKVHNSYTTYNLVNNRSTLLNLTLSKIHNATK